MTTKLGRVGLALALVFSSTAARADGDADRAVARGLAEEGARLLASGRVEAACTKLQESRRLVPLPETGMKLAECYERSGRTASAWSVYLDVAAAERDAHRPQREMTARARAAALEHKIGRLTVAVSDGAGTPGIVVQRDGVAVTPAQWGVSLPLDPGQHEIAAQAPGRYGWRTTIAVNAGETKLVTVPALPIVPVVQGPPVVVQYADEDESPRRRRRREKERVYGERYSTGMMVGGIVLASTSPLLGIIVGVLVAQGKGKQGVENGLIAGSVVGFTALAFGIPLAIIGGRRVKPGDKDVFQVRLLVSPTALGFAGTF